MDDKIEAFVKNGLYSGKIKKMRVEVLLINFFPSIAIIIGFVLKGIYIAISATMLISIFVALIYVIVITRSDTMLNRIKAQACQLISVFINYFLSSVLFYIVSCGVNWRIVLLLIPPVLTALLLLYKTVNRLKSDYVIQGGSKNATAVGTIGGTASIIVYSLLRGLNIAVRQDVAIALIVFFMLGISCIGALGVIDVLKVFCIKQLQKMQNVSISEH